MPDSAVLVCSDVDLGLPASADEDLFDQADHSKLYNWAFPSNPLAAGDLPATSEPILKKITQLRGKFDHALPAHALTLHQTEFAAAISRPTVDRFKELFAVLNVTIAES